MARDKFHFIVREALEKDGWTISDDPFRLSHGSKDIEIDLGAEKLLAAERGTEKIVVEVKSFLTKSAFYELHTAVGQFRNYRRVMRLENVEHELFLAMPLDTFNLLFNDDFGQLTIEEDNLKIIIYSVEQTSIVKWIK
jgi:hypothetical protein